MVFLNYQSLTNFLLAGNFVDSSTCCSSDGQVKVFGHIYIYTHNESIS